MSYKLTKEQLNKASGGRMISPGEFHCNRCMKTYQKEGAECKEIEDGCDTIKQYKCPDCGDWINT